MKHPLPSSLDDYLYRQLFLAVRDYLQCRNKWIETMSVEDNRKLNTSFNRMQSIIDVLHCPLN